MGKAQNMEDLTRTKRCALSGETIGDQGEIFG